MLTNGKDSNRIPITRSSAASLNDPRIPQNLGRIFEHLIIILTGVEPFKILRISKNY